LESGWCWYYFFSLFFEFTCFWDVLCYSFWISCLGREENEKKWAKEKFSKEYFLKFVSFLLVIRTFSTLWVLMIFWLGASEMQKITKNPFSMNSKENFLSEKSWNFNNVFLAVCTVFTCLVSLVLGESVLETKKWQKLFWRKNLSKKIELLFSCNLQVVDYLYSHTFWITCWEYIKNEGNIWCGKLFFGENLKYFFLKSVWFIQNLFALFFQFVCFWGVWCDSFLDLSLRTWRKWEKIFQKEIFFKNDFSILFLFFL